MQSINVGPVIGPSVAVQSISCTNTVASSIGDGGLTEQVVGFRVEVSVHPTSAAATPLVHVAAADERPIG